MDPILSVAQVNRQIRLLLEQEVGEVAVQGEVSNLTQPASGHLYLTLKDTEAQIRCVFFRNRHQANQALQNGQLIIAKGILSLYEARGDYQLIVSEVQDAGLGDLHALFERLKLKLAALGLFEQSRKKPLPRFPACIGVITSASGAALRDILTTLGRRFPQALVLVYPSDVQGKAAASQLTTALMRANHEQRCDVLILARGGGSLEDLWSFNDEQLAFAIANSRIPVVTGVGHETDFTIADFVSDWRAATPTAAAEAVTPDYQEWKVYLQNTLMRLNAMINRHLQHHQLVLKHCSQTLASPEQLVVRYWQKLDYLEHRLRMAMTQLLSIRQQTCQALLMQLSAKHPNTVLLQIKMNIQQLETQMVGAMHMILIDNQKRFQTQLTTLNAVSPLATLDRGYALVSHSQQLVTDSHMLVAGDEVDVRLSRGKIVCRVLAVT